MMDPIRDEVKGTEEMSSSKQVAVCGGSLQGEQVTKGRRRICTGGSVGWKDKESLKRVWCSLAVLVLYG